MVGDGLDWLWPLRAVMVASYSAGLLRAAAHQRDAAEVTTIAGRTADGKIADVTITPEASAVANYAFDVTPARLVTALITERGLARPSLDGLAHLFPEHDKSPAVPRKDKGMPYE